MKKSIIVFLAIMFILLALVGLFYVAVGYPSINEQDRKFISALEMNLKKAGDQVMVEDIYGGEWTKICPVIEYGSASDKAAWALGVSKDTVKLRNKGVVVDWADENIWGYIFLYPPMEAEYLQIPTKIFPYRSGEDCTEKSEAVLEMTTATLRSEIPGIRLLRKGKHND